jgi:hypothetical protein
MRPLLVNSCGIEPGRIVVIAGGNKDKITTKLWLVPEGGSTPKPDSELTISLQHRLDLTRPILIARRSSQFIWKRLMIILGSMLKRCAEVRMPEAGSLFTQASEAGCVRRRKWCEIQEGY